MPTLLTAIVRDPAGAPLVKSAIGFGDRIERHELERRRGLRARRVQGGAERDDVGRDRCVPEVADEPPQP